MALVLPLIVLTAGGILLPLTASRTRAGRGAVALLAVAVFALAGVMSVAAHYDVPGLGFMREAAAQTGGVAYGVYELDAYALAFQLVFLTVAALVALGSTRAMAASPHQGEYYALLTLSTLGMMVVAGSNDLMVLFIGFELSSFSTYALAGYFKDGRGSEAALKYFIIGSLSAALTLFGASILYGMYGSTRFEVIGAETTALLDRVTAAGGAIPPLVVFAWAFLLAGFGYKIAIVPFHNWAPDVYDGSPSTVSAFLAAGSKKMGFAALFKALLVGLIALKADWLWLAGAIAILTMTVGNVAALAQTNVKRMLAYSSIAHAGYMLIALPLAAAGGTTGEYALAGGVFHILTHGIMKTGAFLVVAAVAAYGIGSTIEDWRGLGRRAPLIGFAMAIFLLSLAGLPPLAGFTSKFVLFSAAVQAGGWYIWLAVAGILNSALSLYYYARLLRIMYVDETRPGEAPVRYEGARVAGWGATAAILIACVATIVVGLAPGTFVDLSTAAATALLP